MFPHHEPPFHTDWWSVDRLVPILLMLVLIAVVMWAVVRFTRQPRVAAAGGVDTGPDRSTLVGGRATRGGCWSDSATRGRAGSRHVPADRSGPGPRTASRPAWPTLPRQTPLDAPMPGGPSARRASPFTVGAAGLEPATSCSQSTRASQAALRPVGSLAYGAGTNEASAPRADPRTARPDRSSADDLAHRVQERLSVRRSETRHVVVSRRRVQRAGLVERTQRVGEPVMRVDEVREVRANHCHRRRRIHDVAERGCSPRAYTEPGSRTRGGSPPPDRRAP